MDAARSGMTAPHAAGPGASRRVTDDRGRTWTVREIAAPAQLPRRRTIGLIFACDVPGAVPVLRRVWRPLDRLGEAELLELLQRADD